MPVDALRVIEAAYRLDTPDPAWLKAVAETAYPLMGAGLGLLAFTYQVTPEGRMRVSPPLGLDIPEAMAAQAGASLEQLEPAYIRKTFVRCECTTQSQVKDPEVVAYNKPMMEALAAFGWHDVFMIGGMDLEGHGIYVGAWLPKKTRLSARTRATWSHVAVHLTAAQRLRRRLARAELARPDTADAVLAPEGEIAHAKGEAEAPESRRALCTAVRQLERARGSVRQRDADEAVDLWKGLVSARWTLVDHFESDGRRYVLARRNDVEVGGDAALTIRELQAVGYAALGHSNKLIAYEMGVSASTVAVLLHRAARKLGVRSRAELIARFTGNRPSGR